MEAAKRKYEGWARGVNTWASERPGNYGVDLNAEGLGSPVLRVRLTARVKETPPLKDWSLEVGDILSNLRSALDYAIRELAIIGTGCNPPPGEKKLQFPIFDREKDYRRSEIEWLRGVPDRAREVIEEFQPFRQQLGSTEVFWFWAFREVHNESKHRNLLHLSGALEGMPLTLSGTAIPHALSLKYLGKSLEHGDLLAEFDLQGLDGVPGSLDVAASIRTHLVFHFTAPGKGGPLAGQKVGSAIGAFIAGVEGVLDALERAAKE